MSPELTHSSESAAAQEQLADLRRLIVALTAGSEMKGTGQGEQEELCYSKELSLNNYTKVELLNTIKAEMGPNAAIVYDYGHDDYQMGKLIVITTTENGELEGSMTWDQWPGDEFKAKQMPEWQDFEDFRERTDASHEVLSAEEAATQLLILQSIVDGHSYHQGSIEFKDEEPKNSQNLYAHLQSFLDEHGVEGWPAYSEDGEEHRAVGRNMQAHVKGPRGWNLVNVEQVSDEYYKRIFRDGISSSHSDPIRLDISNSHECFLICPDAVAKFDSAGIDLERMKDHEVEWLFEDLEGLWFGDPVVPAPEDKGEDWLQEEDDLISEMDEE